MNAVTEEEVIRDEPLDALNFMSKSQKAAVYEILSGDERQFAIDIIAEIHSIVNTMPKTYETERGKDSIVYLHYFRGNMDAYITERDMEEEQLQAFGYIDMGSSSDLDYISIEDLIKADFELDLFWEEKPLSEVMGS